MFTSLPRITCLLLTVLSVLSYLDQVVGVHQRECVRWKGQFRDCTCGIKRRDIEDHCKNEHTYFEPENYQETRSCPFVCENGGTFDGRANLCHCRDGYFGLCCESETPPGVCGGVLLEGNGTIRSPGFPKYSYPNNFKCVWRISTDEKRRIVISVIDRAFDVEQGTSIYSCNHDWIDVYDGESRASQRIGSYCGNGMRTLETVQSTGRHMYIEFRSDWQQRRSGFELQYTTVLRSKECGPRLVYNLQTAIIVSPNYPMNYNAREMCKYEIKVSPGHDVILTVLEIDMPSRSDCTGGDRLLVKKTVKGSKMEEDLTVYCGNRQYSRFVVQNATSVFLVFKSDHRRGGTFKLRYNQVPVELPTMIS